MTVNPPLKTASRRKRKLLTIHNGIEARDCNFLAKETAQQKLIGRQSPFVIGTIAEWTRNKGLTFLFEAILKIKERKFDVVLIGSGENPDKDKMYAFVEKHNLKNVYLHEWIPNAASYLKAFDIFVLPSIKEGLPYTLLEAGLAELPVIATKVGGIPEIIGHDEGFLVEPANSDALAEKIEELINNPERGKTMAANLHQKILKEFSLSKMLRTTTMVYE